MVQHEMTDNARLRMYNEQLTTMEWIVMVVVYLYMTPLGSYSYLPDTSGGASQLSWITNKLTPICGRRRIYVNSAGSRRIQRPGLLHMVMTEE